MVSGLLASSLKAQECLGDKQGKHGTLWSKASVCTRILLYKQNDPLMCKGAAMRLSQDSLDSHFTRKIRTRAAHSDAQHTRIFTIVINSSHGFLLLLKLLSAGRIRRKLPRRVVERPARAWGMKNSRTHTTPKVTGRRLISLIWAILSAISDAATR